MEKAKFALALDIWTDNDDDQGNVKNDVVSDAALLDLLASSHSNQDPVQTLTTRATVYECYPDGASVTDLDCRFELVVTGVEFIGPGSSSLREVTCQLLDVVYGDDDACTFFVQNCIQLEPGTEIKACIDTGPRQNGIAISIGGRQLDLMESDFPEMSAFMKGKYLTPAVRRLLAIERQQAAEKIAKNPA